jgi:hypothetical protein
LAADDEINAALASGAVEPATSPSASSAPAISISSTNPALNQQTVAQNGQDVIVNTTCPQGLIAVGSSCFRSSASTAAANASGWCWWLLSMLAASLATLAIA